MENLDGLSQLVSVDLSFNKISKVQDLSGTPKLERLMLKANPISKIQDLEGLKASRSLRHLSFQNVDNSDACPVCSLPEYAKSLRSLCPELLALDSKRLRLPDLDREIRRLDEQNAVDIPEPRPWFSAEELDLGEMQTSEVIEEALKDRIGEFEAAMADCKQVFREAYSADRRQQDAEAAQAVRERQSVWQLRCKLDQSRREARLVARALQHQYADVKRLEAATRQESQYAAQLESKAAQLLASSPAVELRFQGEGELESLHDENRCLLRDIRGLRQSEKERRGEALRLLETAEDCAAVAEVPVDLLGAVGWGQLEVQEAQLSLARTSAARSCAAEEHDSLLWALHSTRQEHRVKVAQLATDESAALSASAERRHFTAEIAACCEAAVFLRNEYNELQAESAREQEDEKACSIELPELESRQETCSRDLLTESFLLNQSREAAQSLRGQVGQIDAALSSAAARRRGLVAEEWRGDALQAAGLRELEVQTSELQSVAALNLKQIRESRTL
ncbi:unnamed protein product [Symbiodinium necroappetens]|uniref:Uncharacterized protein n=1 Tax=Symbiodinium necroappetens TaxID=1628268 RepID=A0A813CK59_9DINO|nr:unnamed protein product [Symbiodinium necroappetens]